MNKNTIKVISKKSDYFIKDNVLFARPVGALPLIAKDNRMYLAYDLGINLVIPTGMIALVMAPNDSSKYSVTQTGNFVLLPGTHENVTIEYKVNTDAIPRVFEQSETCAQIVFVQTNSLTFETEIIEDVKIRIEEDKDEEPALGDQTESMPEADPREAVQLTIEDEIAQVN